MALHAEVLVKVILSNELWGEHTNKHFLKNSTILSNIFSNNFLVMIFLGNFMETFSLIIAGL